MTRFILLILILSIHSVTWADINDDLFEAVVKGDKKKVVLLIKNGADVKHKTGTGWALLHSAAFFGHLDIAKLLIQKGAPVNANIVVIGTPLHSAVSGGHLKMVQLLVRKGANLHTIGQEGMTPLHIAAKMGHMNILKFLIKKGANRTYKTFLGFTPLHEAAGNGHLDIVKYLMSTGVSVDGKSTSWYSWITFPFITLETDFATAYLPGWQMPIHRTPLHHACLRGHLKVVLFLIKEGANIGEKDFFKRTPLHFASFGGHLEIAHLLIDEGAYVHAKDKDGNTPLDAAKSDPMKTLLQKAVRKKDH